MSDGEKVVYLSFKSPRLDDEHISFHTCKNCRNKTFTLTDDDGKFPLLKCAACGAHIGRIGWTDA